MSSHLGGDGGANPPSIPVAAAAAAASTPKPKQKPRTHARNTVAMNNKRRRLSRHKRVHSDRKRTNFDYASVNAQREADGLRPTTTMAEKKKAGGTKQHSPTKARVKGRNTILEKDKVKLTKDVHKWKTKFQREHKRLRVANFEKAEFRKQLKQQEKAFQHLVKAATDEADVIMNNAREMMERALTSESDCEEKILQEKRASRQALQEERGRSSRKRDALQRKHLGNLKKLRDTHTATMISMENGMEEMKKMSVKKMEKLETELTKERVFWQSYLAQADAALDLESLNVDKEKKKSRERIQKAFDKALRKESRLREMVDDLKETNSRLGDADRKHKGALCLVKYWKDKAEKRLRRSEEVEAQNGELHDALVDARNEIRGLQREVDRLNCIVEEQSKIIARFKELGEGDRLDMKKVRGSGRGKGARNWEYWVVQMICELLVAGVPPSAVPQSITIIYETIFNKSPDELPSVSFVRRCRTVIQVVGETIAAIKLAEAEQYDQLFYDATTRRHIPFQCVLVGLLGANMRMDMVCVSSSIFLEDETAETTAESILDKFEHLKQRLTDLRKHVGKHHPEELDSLPHPDGIDIKKMKNIKLMSDSCNSALKTTRILNVKVGGNATELDCHNHLRNTFLSRPVDKALSKHLRVLLKGSLEEIDSTLRVNTPHIPFARAYDKNFSLSANHVKGRGEFFSTWIRENRRGAFLYHVESTHGSRQDIIFSTAMAMYMNRQYNIDFLDYMLSQPGNDNILDRNLFCMLTSSEMVAETRLLALLNMAVMEPLRFLAGKTHEMAEHGWGVLSMGWALDLLHAAFLEIDKNPSLILSEEFMMSIFSKIEEKLPPFKEYLDLTFRRHATGTDVVDRKSGARLMQYSTARREIFDPKVRTNIDSTQTMVTLAHQCVKAVLAEMNDTKKVTHKYLSHHKKPTSFEHCGGDYLLGCKATNDESESALGGATGNIQRGNRIGIANASAVSDAKRNEWFLRVNKAAHADGKKEGMFLQFNENIRRSIIEVGLKDAPATRMRNNEDIERQRLARLNKEALKKEKGLEKASRKLLDAVYLHRMYETDACMKGSVAEVTKLMKSDMSESAKRNQLKTNINIRVVGFGWSQYKFTFTAKRKNKPLTDLAEQLKKIVREEKTMGLAIPVEPNAEPPKRREVPILGTITDERRQLDKNYHETEAKMREIVKKLALERRVRGEDDTKYELFQPFVMPRLKDLVGKRIDIRWPMKNDAGKTEVQWCQGKVTGKASGRYSVNILWDAMPDIKGWETQTPDEVELSPALWKKKQHYGWRMDLDVELYDNYFEDEERQEIEAEDEESEDEDGSSSEEDYDSSSSEEEDWIVVVIVIESLIIYAC